MMSPAEKLLLRTAIRDLEDDVEASNEGLTRLRLLLNPEGLSELWLLEVGVIGPADYAVQNRTGAFRTVRELLRCSIGDSVTLVNERPCSLGVQDPGNVFVKQLIAEHSCEWRKVKPC